MLFFFCFDMIFLSCLGWAISSWAQLPEKLGLEVYISLPDLFLN